MRRSITLVLTILIFMTSVLPYGFDSGIITAYGLVYTDDTGKWQKVMEFHTLPLLKKK